MFFVRLYVFRVSCTLLQYTGVRDLGEVESWRAIAKSFSNSSRRGHAHSDDRSGVICRSHLNFSFYSRVEPLQKKHMHCALTLRLRVILVLGRSIGTQRDLSHKGGNKSSLFRCDLFRMMVCGGCDAVYNALSLLPGRSFTLRSTRSLGHGAVLRVCTNEYI